MYNRKQNFNLNTVVALILLYAVLFSICSCNMGGAESRSSWTSSSVKSVVSEAIDREMEFVKPNLDPDLQANIDNGGAKGSRMSGRQIVDLTEKEQGGSGYIDFCYTVNMDGYADSRTVMDNARPLMSESQFSQLETRAAEVEKAFEEAAESYSKALPESQKEAFYKDLKSLVTRTVVLLTAGIVYAVIPDVILWGKVSAAAAISIGAGLVAITIMTIYEKYRFGMSETEQKRSLKDWMEQLIQVPKADFALTTTAGTLATVFAEGPVVKGITICVFAFTNCLETVSEMMKKYNFNM